MEKCFLKMCGNPDCNFVKNVSKTGLNGLLKCEVHSWQHSFTQTKLKHVTYDVRLSRPIASSGNLEPQQVCHCYVLASLLTCAFPVGWWFGCKVTFQTHPDKRSASRWSCFSASLTTQHRSQLVKSHNVNNIADFSVFTATYNWTHSNAPVFGCRIQSSPDSRFTSLLRQKPFFSIMCRFF